MKSAAFGTSLTVVVSFQEMCYLQGTSGDVKRKQSQPVTRRLLRTNAVTGGLRRPGRGDYRKPDRPLRGILKGLRIQIQSNEGGIMASSVEGPKSARRLFRSTGLPAQSVRRAPPHALPMPFMSPGPRPSRRSCSMLPFATDAEARLCAAKAARRRRYPSSRSRPILYLKGL